jgi:HlyD family secretion protein
VTETDIALVKKGQKAEVLLQALPSRVFAAEVTRIGIEPVREGGVVSYPVTLLVENEEHTLLPGMSARVQMEVARAENVLSVHEAALRFAPEDAEPAPARSRVFVRQGPTEIEAVAVQTGLSDGVYTELRAASAEDAVMIEEGDHVALGLLRPDTGKQKPQVTLGGKK